MTSSNFFLLHCAKCGTDESRPAKFCPKCGSANLIQVALELTADTLLDSRYQIIRPIATGGMAQLYLAQDHRLQRPVAVKRLLPDASLSALEREAYREQFRNEAYILADLEYPGLPKMIDRFNEGGTEFHVMNYIDGQGLDEEFSGAADATIMRNLLVKALNTLDFIHTRQVIHRDIKPDNLMLTKSNHLFLIDFGIAVREEMNLLKQQNVDLIFGSKQYSSPEQVEGRATTPASDIFSLGMTFAHLLIGLDKFLPGYEVRLTRGLETLDLAPIRDKGLAEILAKATHWSAKERFSSAAEMREIIVSQINPNTTLPINLSTPTANQTGRVPAFSSADPASRLDALLLQLSHGASSYQRRMAARQLAEIDDPQVYDALLKALDDTDTEVRQTIVLTLSRKLYQPALPKLRWRLHVESDTNLRETIRLSINTLCYHYLPITQTITSVDSPKWLTNANQLYQDGETALVFMLTAVQDNSNTVRLRAAQWLAGLNGATLTTEQRHHVITVLLEAYKDPTAEIRILVVRGIANLADRETAKTYFLSWLNDRDMGVVLSLIEALKTVGDPSVVPSLLSLGEYHPNSAVRIKAKDAVLALRKNHNSPNISGSVSLTEQLGSNMAEMRVEAARLLCEAKDTNAIPRLATALKYDNDPRVKYFAAKALSEFGTEECIGALIYALDFRAQLPQLDESYKGVRYFAVLGLRRLGALESTAKLKKLRRRETDPNLIRLIDDTITILKQY